MKGGHKICTPTDPIQQNGLIGANLNLAQSARSYTREIRIRQFWMRNQTIRFVDVGLSSGQYFLANPHWIFSYRVNYDVRNWLMIIEQLHASPNDVPVMSRVQLLVDGEAYLSQSATSHLYVYLLSYLANETELGVLLVGMDRVYAFLDTFGKKKEDRVSKMLCFCRLDTPLK